MRSANTVKRENLIINILSIFALVMIVGMFVADGAAAMILWTVGCVATAMVIIAMLFLYFIWRNQEEQTKMMLDAAFNSALSMLGSNQASVREEAIYSLHRLASKNKESRRQVANFLCMYIRCKTVEAQYQNIHRDKPSIDVQAAIDVLFKSTAYVRDLCPALYYIFPEELGTADLSGSYLVGANFEDASCQKVNFETANCQKSNFHEADCRGANFPGTLLQEADFSEARCQGAQFHAAQCQGVNFHRAFVLGCRFVSAQCQGADFTGAYCLASNFTYACCHGANFAKAICHGAEFSAAYCQGADFKDAEFHGAYALGRGTDPSLSERLGKDTEIKQMIVSGCIGKEAIAAIEDAKKIMSDEWHERMQRIVEKNADKGVVCGVPDGAIVGVLNDSLMMQATIRELVEIKDKRSAVFR